MQKNKPIKNRGERMSWDDGSILRGYAVHIQRYQFASDYCRGKSVMDAGCGVGYGSHFLGTSGTLKVCGVDLSPEAIEEARRYYGNETTQFIVGDVEKLPELSLPFRPEVIVNFENLEHLANPKAFLQGASDVLKAGLGTLIVSTPNGKITDRLPDGRPANEFHENEYTHEQLSEMLVPRFRSVIWFGQWESHEGKLRHKQERDIFLHLNEAYYNPSSRFWRMVKKLFGRTWVSPPQLRQGGFTGDFTIGPLAKPPVPWEPIVLIAVCGHGE